MSGADGLGVSGDGLADVSGAGGSGVIGFGGSGGSGVIGSGWPGVIGSGGSDVSGTGGSGVIGSDGPGVSGAGEPGVSGDGLPDVSGAVGSGVIGSGRPGVSGAGGPDASGDGLPDVSGAVGSSVISSGGSGVIGSGGPGVSGAGGLDVIDSGGPGVSGAGGPGVSDGLSDVSGAGGSGVIGSGGSGVIGSGGPGVSGAVRPGVSGTSLPGVIGAVGSPFKTRQIAKCSSCKRYRGQIQELLENQKKLQTVSSVGTHKKRHAIKMLRQRDRRARKKIEQLQTSDLTKELSEIKVALSSAEKRHNQMKRDRLKSKGKTAKTLIEADSEEAQKLKRCSRISKEVQQLQNDNLHLEEQVSELKATEIQAKADGKTYSATRRMLVSLINSFLHICGC